MAIIEKIWTVVATHTHFQLADLFKDLQFDLKALYHTCTGCVYELPPDINLLVIVPDRLKIDGYSAKVDTDLSFWCKSNIANFLPVLG